MRLAIITGADGGMGYEETKAVAQAGYHVIMACFCPKKGCYGLSDKKSPLRQSIERNLHV